MSFDVIRHILASAVATSGTFSPSLPTGRKDGDYSKAHAHRMQALGANLVAPTDFTVAFSSGATVTWKGTTTLPAGTEIILELERIGDNTGDPDKQLLPADVTLVSPVLVDLGCPLTLDADAFVKAATGAELPDASAATTVTYTPDTNGTSPTDGVGSVVTKSGVKYWELDKPRNAYCLTTHGSSIVAMTVTVTGLDQFGAAISENISVAATGTSEIDQGVKAFKWIRSIKFTVAADATTNTANVGFGDVLGLPFFVPGTALAFVLKELQDNAVASAGTVVAGVTTPATATTGDVRGTYDPNAACNGALNFKLAMLVPDPTDRGVPQFGG